MAQPERPGPRRRRRPGASSRSPAASAPASAAVSVTAAAAAAAPEGGKRRRGRPRIRTELELEQRRKAWYRRRYVCSVYLGQQCERWKRIRHQLGHSKDEQTAQRLLDCFTARSRGSYSGKVCSAENLDHLHTSCDALRLLMVWSHQHSQECGFIPNLKSIASGRLDDSDSPTVLWSCAGGHSYTWEMLPPRRGAEAGGAGPGEGRAGRPTPRGAAGRTRRRVLSSLPPDGKRSHPGPREGSPSQQEAAPVVGETAKERDTPASSGSATPQGAEGPAVPAPPALPRGSPERPSEGQGIQAEPDRGAPSPPGSGTGTGTTTTTPPGRTRRARRKTGQPAAPTPTGNADLLQLVCESDSEEQPVNTARDTGEQLQQQEGSQESEMQVAETELLLTSDNESEEDEELLTEVESEDEYQFFDDPKDENYIPSSESGSDREKRRGRPRRNSTKKPPPEEPVNRKPTKRRVRRDPSEQPKKIRKKVPKQYVRCEFEGCGKIVSNPQYLKRHMKYQHLLHRTFACSHPSCGRIFRFKTQMEDHERLHSDQRNYICEFCGRAFKTDKNLVVHRRIHTGEKPLQCEICGFTCRQKASLNWHMKKHDAEAGYQFSCDVCGKRFEKKDNVSAHKSKSHPEVLLSSVAGLTGLEEGGAYSEGPSLVPETPSAHPGPLETEGWARLDQGSCLEGGIRLEVWTRLEQGSGHLGPGRGLEDGESHLAAEEP